MAWHTVSHTGDAERAWRHVEPNSLPVPAHVDGAVQETKKERTEPERIASSRDTPIQPSPQASLPADPDHSLLISPESVDGDGARSGLEKTHLPTLDYCVWAWHYDWEEAPSERTRWRLLSPSPFPWQAREVHLYI